MREERQVSLLQRASDVARSSVSIWEERDGQWLTLGGVPVHGYYLTQPANKARQDAIRGLLAAEGAASSVLPFVAEDDPADGHRTRVHKAHIAAVKACRVFGRAPCLLLEDDASWPAGKLGSTIAAVVREQGHQWDLLMLGMGNGKQLNGSEVLAALQPTNTRATSTRISGTLCGCHAYVVNGRHRSQQQVLRMLRHRHYRREKFSQACVEGLDAGVLRRFGLRVVSTRWPFAQQTLPAGGPSVYDWRL